MLDPSTKLLWLEQNKPDRVALAKEIFLEEVRAISIYLLKLQLADAVRSCGSIIQVLRQQSALPLGSGKLPLINSGPMTFWAYGILTARQILLVFHAELKMSLMHIYLTVQTQ